MIPITTMAGQRVAVFGLGMSGRATCAALEAGGARVAAWDDNATARAAFEAGGGRVEDLGAADWGMFAALVLAPGVPLTHPAPHWTVERARLAGVSVIGDVELFARERQAVCPDAPFVAITGTNGKSTTTALIAHILKSAGRDAQMGGNIGVPILALEPPAPDRVHVIELSSFQIDLMPTLRPSIGVVMNVSPDHIDRHGTLANYAAIKARVVANADYAVVGADNEISREIAERLSRSWVQWLPISGEAAPWGCYADGRRVVMREGPDGEVREVATLDGLVTLRGAHNGQNAAAAAAVVLKLGLSTAELQAGLASFPGLAHRMEEVGRVGCVIFVNDSKATNADSTDKALASFPRDIYWIAGGRAKEGGIAPLAPYFPRIAKAYLIGEAAEPFAETLEGQVPFEMSGTLDRAVADAARDAAASTAKEPIVLLSPACASYDQFRSFEVRGDAFKALVGDLDGVVLRRKGAS